MTSLFIGLYGLYLILVGIRGNASLLVSEIGDDAPNYLPWLLAIVLIALMSEFDATRDFVKPFAFLLVLNFALSNFDTIKTEASAIYNLSQKES